MKNKLLIQNMQFDGTDMTFKTHDEAVNVFRSVQIGHVAKMLIDREYLLLHEDRTQSMTTFSTLAPTVATASASPISTSTQSTQNQTPKSMTASESKSRLTSHGISAVIERLETEKLTDCTSTIPRIRGKVHDEEDAQSVTSYAPSTHSIIDDVPRTPRKPLSLLDPRK